MKQSQSSTSIAIEELLKANRLHAAFSNVGMSFDDLKIDLLKSN